MRVVSLHLYPIKSVRGHSVSEVAITPRGFKGDRRWLVTTPTGQFYTQRELPRLACISADYTVDGLVLKAPGMPDLAVAAPTSAGPLLPVTVWESLVPVPMADAAAEAWLSQFLQTPVRLVYLPDDITRPCTSSLAGAGDEVSFADTFAFLLTSMASLADLNTRTQELVPMDRFRPNIVIDGEVPWAEDGWQKLRIGEAEIELLKPCARCKITTTDQLTGEQGREPLSALRRFRFNPVKKGLMFGMNGSPRSGGVIRVGDAVEVISTQEPPSFAVARAPRETAH